MNDKRPKQDQQLTETSPRQAHAALDEALNTLEGMLTNPETEEASYAVRGGDFGQEPTQEQSGENAAIISCWQAVPVVARDEVCQGLIQRLASEIEVIVQTSLEKALRRISRDIREQVKNHIDIMLPEILEELSHLNIRKDAPGTERQVPYHRHHHPSHWDGEDEP